MTSLEAIEGLLLEHDYWTTAQELAEFLVARGVVYDPTALTAEESDVIRREIREGTPNTPERIATMKRADEAYARDLAPLFNNPYEVKSLEVRLQRAEAWATQNGECKFCNAETCRGVRHEADCPFHV